MHLIWDNDTQSCDIERSTDGRIVDSDGLETAVLISLLTDARADAGDDVDPTDLRGWWGDSYPEFPGDKLGGKLWQVMRKKANAAGLRLAKEYIIKCLAWMLADGVASAVDVSVESLLDNSRPIGVATTITITRPGDTTSKWSRLWEIRYGV